MAYLDVAGFDTSAGLVFAPGPDGRVAAEPARFSALEWSVIALARRDRLSSLRTPARLSIALGSLFGVYQNPRLADERLEALRRMAVLCWWRRYAAAPSERRAFFAAGFTVDQYELLLASIAAARAAEAGRR